MKKFLCVCGVGQGTSLLLRMNVSDVLKKYGVKAEVDNTDITSAASERSDYIITNSVFAQQLSHVTKPIIIVENYFDLNEIEKALKENSVIE